MNSNKDYYRVLHVHPDAPAEIIKASYRTLMQRLRMHPDLGGNGNDAALINEAYRVLMEPARRRVYDQSRKSSQVKPGDAHHGNGMPENAGCATSGQLETVTYLPNRSAAAASTQCTFCHMATEHKPDGTEPDFCTMCGSPLRMRTFTGDDSDRRSLLRVDKPIKVVFRTQWPQPVPFNGACVNVSLTGMRMRSSVALEVGQLLAAETNMLQAVAEVTRVTHPGISWDVGVKFVTLHIKQTRGSFLADCV
ncbi:MAG: DnaJ domain-containing protein [Pseudomonadota bacterium]